MAERIRWVTHKGRQILRIDYSGLRAEEFLPVIAKVPTFYKDLQKDSVLSLTDVSNSFGNEEAVEALKRLSRSTKPYDKKCAVLGVTGIKGVLLMAVNLFAGQSVKPFDNEQAALDWLAT